MIIEYLTAILVFVTAIYAYLTHRMAKASEASVEAVRQQSEDMLRPYVSVSPFIKKEKKEKAEKQRGQPLTRDKLESMLPSDEQRR